MAEFKVLLATAMLAVATLALAYWMFIRWQAARRKRRFNAWMANQPDIQITEYPELHYDGISIRSMGFSGLINWSPSHKFGFATGRGQNFTVNVGLYMVEGKPRWTVGYDQAMDVWLCDDGRGVFQGRTVENTEYGVVVFDEQGLVGLIPKNKDEWWGKLTGLNIENDMLAVQTERDTVYVNSAGERV